MKSQTPTEFETAHSGLERSNQVPLAPEKPPSRRSSRWAWLWLPVLALLGAGAWYLWSKNTPSATNTSAPGAGRTRGSGAIPVVATKARRGNIGVYITGLGSVTPVYTVTVKSRVDGQLMKVHYKEGDMVREGDLLLEIDPRPYQVQLTQAEGQLLRDQASLQNAHVDLDRYETLLKQNAIPEQQLATQKALVLQDEGIVKTDQGAIDSAKLNLTYCRIAAPISGRVGLRLVDPGNIVHSADTNGLLVITQIDPISVIFTVAEDDLSKILRRFAAGQRLRVDAYDRDNRTKLGSGTLQTIDNQIDPTTGSLRLRAVFENKNHLLFPNQFVNVNLLVVEKSGVTLVPSAVIQRNTTTSYVYAVKDDKTVTVHQVETGTTEGNDTELTSGVAPGDVLVMTGVDKLVEGSKVNVQLADAQPGTGAKPGPGAAGAAKSGGRKK